MRAIQNRNARRMGKPRARVRAANEVNPLIEGYLNERFVIELAMGRLRAYKKSTGRRHISAGHMRHAERSLSSTI